MSGNLTFLACEALRVHFEANEPALVGVVEVLDQLPTTLQKGPAVVIQPERAPHVLAQPGLVRQPDGSPVVPAAGRPVYVNGSFENQIRLWVSHRSARGREFFIDAINNALNQEAAPGRIRVTVPNVKVAGVESGWDAVLTFTYGRETEWREEMVFSIRRWSFLGLEMSTPMLSLRKGEHIVTDMRLVFDQDRDAVIPEGTSPADALEIIEDEEEYQVDENAVLTEV